MKKSKQKNTKLPQIDWNGRAKHVRALVFIALFAALPATAFMLSSSAAETTVMFEAEAGSPTAPAINEPNTSASARGVLAFGTTQIAPAPTPTTPPAGSGTTHAQNLAKARDEYANDPRVNCSAYPEKRIFLETQEWWMDNDSIKFPSTNPQVQLPVDGEIGGHTHTGTCFPHDQQVTGKLKFDVRMMLHKGNRGKVLWLDVGVGPSGTSLAHIDFSTPLTCPGAEDPAKNCVVWIPIEVDTARVPSGYQELRFRFNVTQPNGERMFASTGWQAWFHGGTSTYRKPTWIEARGWYENANYANARFQSAVPYGKISGKWTFNSASVPGAGGLPVTQHGVFVDGFFNLDDFGTIITEGTGTRDGPLTIDTTKLDNGLHYLAILTSQKTDRGGTNTGLLNVPFIVQN